MKSSVGYSEESALEEKHQLRRHILSARQQMGAEARQKASASICEKIKKLPAYQKAETIAAFAPMDEEVDIWIIIKDLLKKDKTVCLPRIESYKARTLAFHTIKLVSDLEKNTYGIWEPPACQSTTFNEHFDFIIVPAVALDFEKKRLGYGGGFYDTFLSGRKNTLTCSPVFNCQITTVVPVQAHDCKIDLVITEEE